MPEHVCQCPACASDAYPDDSTWAWRSGDPKRESWNGAPPWKLHCLVNGERRYMMAATPGVVGAVLTLAADWPQVNLCMHDCLVNGPQTACEVLEYGNVQIGDVRKEQP